MFEISVIIPVYNIEKYIERCIESIVRQSFQNIEIIAVDDGSTDKSGEILDSIARKNKKIKVIHKENGGVTSARIAGLESASGKWVGFVDGDDYISENMYEKLYTAAKENNVDAVYTQIYFVNYKNEITVVGNTLKTVIYEKENLDRLIENMFHYTGKKEGGMLVSVCCNIYKKETVTPIFLNIPKEIRLAEDAAFTYAYTSSREKIFVLNEPFYYYCRRENSSTEKIYNNYLIQVNKMWLFLKEHFENHRKAEILMPQLKKYIINKMFILKLFSNKILNLYLFPYEKIEKDSNIIIYGAGEVGASYYRQLKKNNYCNVVLLADLRFNELSEKYYPVENPDKIKETNFDYILISVLSEKMAKSISVILKEKYNVKENKIIIHNPVGIGEIIDV